MTTPVKVNLGARVDSTHLKVNLGDRVDSKRPKMSLNGTKVTL